MTANRSISRADALRRSYLVFDRAAQQFRGAPTALARKALEHSMAALQWAALLEPSPDRNAGPAFDRWELAWVWAYVAMYRLTRRRIDN